MLRPSTVAREDQAAKQDRGESRVEGQDRGHVRGQDGCGGSHDHEIEVGFIAAARQVRLPEPGCRPSARRSEAPPGVGSISPLPSV